MMDDMLFVFTRPPAPKPKPLHTRSEQELLDYARAMEMERTTDRERDIKRITAKFMEHWAATRNMPQPFQRLQFATMPTISCVFDERAPKPVSEVVFREINIFVPAFFDPDQAEFLAERMIREQMGEDHIPA